MKYQIIVIISMLFILTQNSYADFGRVFNNVNGVVRGIVETVENSKSRQPAQQRQPVQQRQNHYQKPIVKPQKPKKRRVVPKDQSPIAIAYYSLPKEKKFILQARLKDKGLYTSKVDGVWGRGTKKAINSFAENNNQRQLLNTFGGAEILVSNIINDRDTSAITDKSEANAQINIDSTGDITSTITTIYTKDLSGLESRFEDIQNQVELLEAIVADQENRPENSFRNTKIEALQDQIAKYNGEQKSISITAQRKYKTPIRPQNDNLGITATKASETFPKIPYYIPGTNETGDMWVKPRVSDIGKLFYSFTFMDPVSDYAKVRDSIDLESKDVELMVKGFEKVNDWTNISQDKGIRKRYSKRAICFPAEDCLEKRIGNTSTEVIFLIYENGSTAAKVQRNKGNFSSDYNFSLESSMMLAAYLEFVKGVGQKEFETGSMTEKDLGTLFE